MTKTLHWMGKNKYAFMYAFHLIYIKSCNKTYLVVYSKNFTKKYCLKTENLRLRTINNVKI